MEDSEQLRTIPLSRLDCKYCRFNGNGCEGEKSLYPYGGSFHYCFKIGENYIEEGGDVKPNSDISTSDKS